MRMNSAQFGSMTMTGSPLLIPREANPCALPSSIVLRDNPLVNIRNTRSVVFVMKKRRRVQR